MKLTRSLLLLIAIATFAAPSVQAGPMHRAAKLSQEAHDLLKNEATADKGGHRIKAMNLLRQAINEINAGVEFDKANVTAGERKKKNN